MVMDIYQFKTIDSKLVIIFAIKSKAIFKCELFICGLKLFKKK